MPADFDVLINNSRCDTTIASALWAALEVSGYRCWYRELDFDSDKTYVGSAWDAIDRCRAVVALHSERANHEEHVLTITAKALTLGRPVYLFRIDDTEELNLVHDPQAVRWLDASDLRLDRHFSTLARLLRGALDYSPHSIDQEADELLVEPKPDTLRAWEQLIARYASMVRAEVALIVSRRGRFQVEEELFNEGMIGLYRAVHDYEPGGSRDFSSYARSCIRGRLLAAFHTSGRAI